MRGPSRVATQDSKCAGQRLKALGQLPATMAGDEGRELRELEKVRIYWDYRNGRLLWALGFFFTALVAALPTLSTRTELVSQLSGASVFVLLLGFIVLYHRQQMRHTALQVDGLLAKVGRGEPIGELSELLGVSQTPGEWIKELPKQGILRGRAK